MVHFPTRPHPIWPELTLPRIFSRYNSRLGSRSTRSLHHYRNNFIEAIFIRVILISRVVSIFEVVLFLEVVFCCKDVFYFEVVCIFKVIAILYSFFQWS